ncbi:MAG: hypothetical protein WBJ33_06670 [Candidatus Nanopelagicales bacterium]
MHKASNDATAILPVRIGTAIALICTVIIGFTAVLNSTPLGPDQARDSGQVWWFGVGLFASLSGILGLVFLHWRARKLTD